MTPGPEVIARQLERFWTGCLEPGLSRITTAEYRWEPVRGCWNIRPAGDGTFTVDYAHPAPVPPPVTTIAWRMAFIVTNLSLRAHHHFDGPAFSPTTVSWPPTIDEARILLDRTVRRWLLHVRRLTSADLSKRAGPAEGKYHAHSIGEMLLNANCQVIHHGGAILLQHAIHRAAGVRYQNLDCEDPGGDPEAN